MKQIDSIFTSKGRTDSKCKLNRLEKKVDQSILDQIEAGITLEQLDNISKSGIPIFKYGTQITIHGLFSNLENNYIFGYKNIFQNKNKSIGVKYNAIDENKRRVIAKRLDVLGFYYRRNSTGTEFQLCKVVTPETFETIKAEMTTLFKRIDKDLYFGNSYFYAAAGFGCKFLVIDIYINAIYEKNIELFLNKMGATSDLLEAKKESERIENEKRQVEYKKEQTERENKRKQAIENSATDLKVLQRYPIVEKSKEPGLYILRTFDYNDNLIYKVVYVYLIKGKQKPRFNRSEYIALNEALNHKPEPRFSDSIYSGKVTGYKIA